MYTDIHLGFHTVAKILSKVVLHVKLQKNQKYLVSYQQP